MTEPFSEKASPKKLKQIFIEQLTNEGISWEATLILEGQMLTLFKKVAEKWLQQNLIDITKLEGAEIYDANLINDYIKDKLLGGLRK